MSREMLPYLWQISYNMDLGLLNISPLFIQLLCSTRQIIRPAEGGLHLAIAIALFILIYGEFQTKDAHQFIHNMHTSTMFALTLAKRALLFWRYCWLLLDSAILKALSSVSPVYLCSEL